MTTSGCIAVDLDGTLAFYDGWKGESHIGEPVPAMVERVKQWLAEGTTVKIFTARVGISGGYSLESNRFADKEFADNQVRLIQDWCEKHIGQRLEVTATKDFTMTEFYDDRAWRVEKNTGKIIGVETFIYDHVFRHPCSVSGYGLPVHESEVFEDDACLCPKDGHYEMCPIHKTKSSPR